MPLSGMAGLGVDPAGLGGGGPCGIGAEWCGCRAASSRDTGEVSVRRRAVGDLPGCVRALEAAHAADAYPMWWPADPAGWLSPVGWTAAWVAELAGVVVGHVCVVRGVEDPLSLIHISEPTRPY